MHPTTANMTTAISTSTKGNPTAPFSADFPSEQINSMETEEHQKTTLTTTTTRMNTTHHTASNVDTISEQPVVVVVVSDDDEDTVTDADADKDVPMKATPVLVSSTHLSSSSSIVSSSQRRRKEKHRQRREVIRVVRFKKEEEGQQDNWVQQKATKREGKKMIRRSTHNKTPSASWYTSQEMKDNYKQSIARSSNIRMGVTDDEQGRTQQEQQQQCTTTSAVSWFSYEKRMQRRRRRKQMYKIMQAIQDYEVATHTKVPELLSQLLARHSQPMVEEGLRIAVVVASASTTDDTVVC